MARKKKPEIDFEMYCKIKHDGDEYQALRALAKVTIEDNTAVAGLSDEGYEAVCDSLTQEQLSTLWEIIRIALREDPVRLAEFIAFCEESEKRKQSEAERMAYERSASNYVLFFIICIIAAVVLIVGIINGTFSLSYLFYLIVDAIITVSISGRVFESFRNRK
ncbi:MAG: hypothetical protein IJD22_03440 [Clostridia bacterium]|nr:hypothetical protein [Clostridia bacterium]